MSGIGRTGAHLRAWPATARLLFCGVAFLACRRPPDVPTRPLEKFARVELQIDNSATQSDDYVMGTTAKPARIRLRNTTEVTGPVPVTLKNLDFQPGPSLVFGTTSTPAAASLDLDLPADGSWVPLFVAGGGGQLSARDKDAVIEILERRADGIVLGRKSLMVASANPFPPSAFDVEITIGDAETFDDYVTWRPVRGSIRLVKPGGGPDVDVTMQNMSPVTGGRLVFGQVPASSSSVSPPPMSASITLALPRNGTWVDFYVAGDFGVPSVNDKDAVIEIVRQQNGHVLGREGVMVRVRKNANALTVNERDRFLNAIARLNLGLGTYVTYQQIHHDAGSPFNPGHSGPAFLAWHRAYILRYERELQVIDPAVALHYWRFDQGAPAVFNSAFMGAPAAPGGNAIFDATNPLSVWAIEGLSGIPRRPRFTAGQSPTDFGINTEIATLALGGPGNTYASFRMMEGNPHGGSHTNAGYYSGWIASVPTAVRDPLFFLLHSNVERLWAKWQWVYARQDPAVLESYNPQGAYTSAGPSRLGHYAEDTMWPWDGRTGVVNAGEPLSERPAVAPGGALPAAIGGWGPPAWPRPKDVVDYDRWTLLGTSGLGYGYDDVPFVF